MRWELGETSPITLTFTELLLSLRVQATLQTSGKSHSEVAQPLWASCIQIQDTMWSVPSEADFIHFTDREMEAIN